MKVRTFDCKICLKESVATASNQRYCKSCTSQKSKESSRRFNRQREAGAKRSELNRFDKQEILQRRSEMRHSVVLDVAYQSAVSKNRTASYGGKRVFLRPEARALKDEISTLLFGSGKWFSGKVWLDFYVEKPSARVDAINVIDTLCDGIKIGIGVDDRWYSIGILDWVIVKNNPRIYVVISQNIEDDHKTCTFCGNDYSLTSFIKNKASADGYSNACQGCSSKEWPEAT